MQDEMEIYKIMFSNINSSSLSTSGECKNIAEF